MARIADVCILDKPRAATSCVASMLMRLYLCGCCNLGGTINELYDEGTHMFEKPKIYKVTNGVVFDDARKEFAEWMTVNEDLVFRPFVEMSKEEKRIRGQSIGPRP